MEHVEKPYSLIRADKGWEKLRSEWPFNKVEAAGQTHDKLKEETNEEDTSTITK